MAPRRHWLSHTPNCPNLLTNEAIGSCSCSYFLNNVMIHSYGPWQFDVIGDEFTLTDIGLALQPRTKWEIMDPCSISPYLDMEYRHIERNHLYFQVHQNFMKLEKTHWNFVIWILSLKYYEVKIDVQKGTLRFREKNDTGSVSFMHFMFSIHWNHMVMILNGYHVCSC